MKKRTITGLILVIVLLPFLLIRQLVIPLQIIIGLGLAIGVLEITNMYNKQFKLSTKIINVLLALILYVAIILKVNAYYLTAAILSVIFILLILQTFNEDYTGNNFGKQFSTIFYIGFAAGSLMSVRSMGIRFIVFMLLITSLTDVFAYLIGVRFGKHKMAPTISPKKSWEGAIGGTLVAVTVASLVGIFYGKLFTNDYFNYHQIETIIDLVSSRQLTFALKVIIIVLTALMISISGQLGDLLASKMKRNFEIKDFGHIFPGHGGVMDRFDSAFFASMSFYVILLVIEII